MQFLNPFVLFGLAAAGIPVLLHLLNLRKLRTVEFSSLRFLQELQQTRVRRLRLQQMLLLVLRTLLVVLAVMAFARPTIPTVLPVLGSEARTSVVILVDNSGSMEAADQRGVRFEQAKEAAKGIIASLTDGDEVAILPMAGLRLDRVDGFTRSLAAARESVDRLERVSDLANLFDGLRAARLMLSDASHAHHDIIIVTDAQSNILPFKSDDSLRPASGIERIIVVPIGEGRRGVELNCSVDSVALLTAFIQSDKPVEIEAWIRNGSDADVASLPVGLSFNGVRVAQRAIDIPAGETRSVVLASPPQRTGVITASVDLDDDAIDADNTRHLALVVLPPPRVAIVGPPAMTLPAETVLGVKGYSSLPHATVYPNASQVLPVLSSYDVVMVCGGVIRDAERNALVQYVRNGGGLVVFASEDPSLALLVSDLGMRMASISEAGDGAPYRIVKVEGTHPLFEGVFRMANDVTRTVDLPVVRRQREVGGQQIVMSTAIGGLLAESQVGLGRVLAVGVAPSSSWSTLPSSGVFPAFVVRSVLYTSARRGTTVTVRVGDRTQIDVRTAGANPAEMRFRDVYGIEAPAQVVTAGQSTTVLVPAQFAPGVAMVTADTTAIAGIAVQAATVESRLDFISGDTMQSRLQSMVGHDYVDVISTTRPISEAYRASLRGSELWPLFVVLAVIVAVIETLVARFGARDGNDDGELTQVSA